MMLSCFNHRFSAQGPSAGAALNKRSRLSLAEL